MNEQKLFKEIHDQVLDYADEELIWKCANWGYEVSQILLKHGRYVVQAGAEQSSPFVYAVVTAVTIGEFAERAFNDHFNEEISINLGALDTDFEEIRGFLNKDIKPERLELLKESNTVGLQDVWTALWEWKSDTHKSLVEIYKEQGEKDPNYRIFISLLNIYKDTDEGGTFYRSMTDAQKQEAYEFVSNGF